MNVLIVYLNFLLLKSLCISVIMALGLFQGYSSVTDDNLGRISQKSLEKLIVHEK
jgi:hypothetical protein